MKCSHPNTESTLTYDSVLKRHCSLGTGTGSSPGDIFSNVKVTTVQTGSATMKALGSDRFPHCVGLVAAESTGLYILSLLTYIPHTAFPLYARGLLLQSTHILLLHKIIVDEFPQPCFKIPCSLSLSPHTGSNLVTASSTSWCSNTIKEVCVLVYVSYTGIALTLALRIPSLPP